MALGIWVCFALMEAGHAESVDLYQDRIKPVLRERCYACHGTLKQKAGLRLDTAEYIRSGAENGKKPVVAPHSSASSEILKRLTSADADFRMPPEGEPLAPDEIEAVRAWIDAGAPVPEHESGEEDPRDHWAFQPVQKPGVPGTSGGKHPIDSFLELAWKENGLQPQPQESDRPLLLRRLYLDLIGLPPSLKQLKDERPWETIVDELLASPHHGERWARHWMDVWRYSDWYGLGAQLRYSQKHLWHWRDWIVESLNEDKGYDRMILEMLAGDELAPSDPEVIRATGFLARNYFLFNRTTWLDNTIEHTGKAFLGLTFNCAKCHDHKYDPIDTADYYRFRAIFEPHQVRLDPVPGVIDFEKDGLPRVFDDHPDAETWIHLKGDPKRPDKETVITPGVPAFLASFAPEIKPVKLPRDAYAPGSRKYVEQDRLAEARARVDAARASLAAAQKKAAEAPDNEAEIETTGIGLTDEFDRENSELWDLSGEGWEFRDGKLIQTRASRDRAMLRSKDPHPRDFELTCRYTTTGGTTYKSVTFRFDLSDDGDEANFVYTSAHAPGPKVQVAHTTGGKTTYPSQGRVARPIFVGKPCELRFAVRDRLINVWLDDEFLLAYQLPGRIPNGKLALSAFDATAAFDSIKVRPLPPDLKLTEAFHETPAVSPETLAKTVVLEKARLASARAQLASIEATIQAGDDAERRKAAARLQAETRKAEASFQVLQHEKKGGDAKKLKAAKTALAEATKTLADGTAKFSPLRGAKKALETPAHEEADYPTTYPEVSTGRRLMLARWIVSPENPLTARVAVNHVWMRHFGEPLVPTVFDFGRQAARPEHAELLDYLAAEFVQSGWSFRHLHRLMVTSDAYRRTSSNAGADPATLAADPTNRYYWRMNPRRMESQVVRDSLLHLAGNLDLTTGGPSVDAASETRRRGLYFTHSPDKIDLFLSTFDDADLLQCYRRAESVVPQQALALSNSELSLKSAEAIAAQISREISPSVTRAEFAEAAFEMILARQPDASEKAECLHFFEELDSIAEGEKRLRTQLVHALLNHNDFVTIR